MIRKTALSTAGALAMTSAAAVSALFLTIGQGAENTTSDTSSAPIVRTEYEIVQLEPVAAEPDPTPMATTTATPRQLTVYEIDYVQAEPTRASTAAAGEYRDDDDWEEAGGEHDEHDDDEEEGDDD